LARSPAYAHPNTTAATVIGDVMNVDDIIVTDDTDDAR
jgi:hypothetical protein